MYTTENCALTYITVVQQVAEGNELLCSFPCVHLYVYIITYTNLEIPRPREIFKRDFQLVDKL